MTICNSLSFYPPPPPLLRYQPKGESCCKQIQHNIGLIPVLVFKQTAYCCTRICTAYLYRCMYKYNHIINCNPSPQELIYVCHLRSTSYVYPSILSAFISQTMQIIKTEQVKEFKAPHDKSYTIKISLLCRLIYKWLITIVISQSNWTGTPNNYKLSIDGKCFWL